jgi:hypothetical protein
MERFVPAAGIESRAAVIDEGIVHGNHHAMGCLHVGILSMVERIMDYNAFQDMNPTRIMSITGR